MIVVKIQAGLGNQMFEYALAKWFQAKGKSVKLNISSYEMKNTASRADIIHNGYELERIFGIHADYADLREACKLGSLEKDVFHKALRRVFGVKKTHIRREQLGKGRWYFPQLAERDNIFVDGYWCTFKYADDIDSIIRQAYKFVQPLTGQNADLAKKMKMENSVSIHIRHGDYLQLTDWCHVLSADYYHRAMEYIRNRVDNPVFYCFSDDLQWCKENLKADNIVFVDGNHGQESYRDMQLMSLCKHNVVANSTFSMWGAWLNSNPDKIVIRPQSVFVNVEDEVKDFWPDTWVVLEN